MPGLALGLGLGLGLPGLAQKPNPGTGGMTPGVESTPSNLSDSLGRPMSPDDPVYQERRMRHQAAAISSTGPSSMLSTGWRR